MRRSLARFEQAIDDAKALSTLHGFLTSTVRGPYAFDDLLRAELAYSVSAFDKLIHDLVAVGMVETFGGTRKPTPAYLAEPISMQVHINLVSAGVPPAELVFQTEVVRKLGFQSFQEPDKVAKGLSLIWDESNKWVKVANLLGRREDDVRTELKLIVGRRNAIVHEADIDPTTGLRASVEAAWVRNSSDFVLALGKAIQQLVS